MDNLGHTAVMTEMDNLYPGGLYDSSHDIDGGIMTVKKRGSRNNSDLVSGLINFGLTH